MTKAYEYCEKSIKLKTTPKYVKRQMKEFMKIEEGKDKKYVLSMARYEAIEKILKLLIMPKGLKAGQSLFDCTTGYQWLIYTAVMCTVYRDNPKRRRYETCILEIPRKNFKALSLDTPIPTPDGWRTMGEIHTGDLVFARNGKATKVIGESEVFNKPMYEVEFEDGEIIKASCDHIWTVKTKDSANTARSGRKHIGKGKIYRVGGWYETTTQEMAENYKRPRRDGKGIEYKYRIPMQDAVEYPRKNLPIDPYLLGVWLGDGTSSGTNITVSVEDKNEIMYHIEKSSGYTTEYHEAKNRTGYIKVDKQRSSKINADSFIARLKELNLLNNKHIPEIYLTASTKQRWELLKGIMDTDGSCSIRGQCSFIQKSEQLSIQVLELINSLGIKARLIKRKAILDKKEVGDVCFISFWTTKEKTCFKLKRKTERLKESLADRSMAKSIVRITPAEATPSKCIMVEDGEHLYLAGKHYTATHNTYTCATLFIVLFITEPKFSEFYSVAPDGKLSREIKDAITKTIKSSPMVYEYDGKARFKLLRDYIEFIPKESKYTPLNYSNSNMDGKLPNVYCADEVGALPNTYAIEAMQSGQLNILNKLGFIISTKYPTIDNPIEIYTDYAKKILDGVTEDESVFALLYEPDNPKAWETDDNVMRQANPVSLEVPEIWDDLLKKRAKAIAMESARENFVTKHCNIVYQGAGTETFIDVKDVQNCKVESIDWSGRVVYLGLDLSESNDNTSVAMVSVDDDDNILADVVAFIPEGRIDEKNAFEKIDYREFVRSGKAIACGDKVIDYAVVEDYIMEIESKYGVQVQAVGYDRYNALSTAQKLERAGYNTVEVRQHSSVLHPATKRLKEKILAGEFQYTSNRLMEINFQNARCTQDTNRNLYVNKKRSKGKVDEVVAIINACYLLEQDYFLNQMDFCVQVI